MRPHIPHKHNLVVSRKLKQSKDPPKIFQRSAKDIERSSKDLMNTNTKNLDLDGFPILRLDQISLIDTNLLSQAQVEVHELIQKMNQEKNNNSTQKSLIYYLNKQLNEMNKEITKRIAEERVLALLDGRDDYDDQSSLLRQRQMQSTLSPSSHSISCSKESIQQEEPTPTPIVKVKPKFEPIPLPSEIRKQTMTLPLTSQSSRSEQDIQIQSSKSEEQSLEQNQQPKRPKSGQPSRRSLAVVEENFGNSFIVGAIEKRKRFYPKRVPKESEADIREKNRESRY